eukprot:14272167-Alexandrium_andersonii.AAC.1
MAGWLTGCSRTWLRPNTTGTLFACWPTALHRPLQSCRPNALLGPPVALIDQLRPPLAGCFAVARASG